MKSNHVLSLGAAAALWIVAVAQAAQGVPNPNWVEFRQEFPFHLQTLALSKPDAAGQQTLIVAEPPPEATVAGIQDAAPTLMAQSTVGRHRIGVDGWVKDVIGTFTVSPQVLANEIASLSRYLYGTSYKAYAIALPVDRKATAPLNLDVRVRADELVAWLKDSTPFRPLGVGGSNSLPLSWIYGSGRTEVYYGMDFGLVVWWVPTGTKLSEHRAIVRRFALDTDLLVGGLIKEGGVLVVGRERITPLELVPPLRTETLILLANVEKDELAQSYERMYPLAGRIGERRDWAPILLSPELRHTEFGGLLNITDQLLKGWTMAGMIKYDRFEKYPLPARYPFHDPKNPNQDRPLYHLLREQLRAQGGEDISSLVFNWNTSGAGYAVKYPSAAVYAVNRTGALPVTYIPDGTEGADEAGAAKKVVRQAMETGYAYYAGLDDPNLARVFEYTSFFQLFQTARTAGIWKSTDDVVSQPQPERVLQKQFVEVLERLKDNPDKVIAQLGNFLPPPSPSEIAGDAADIAQKLAEVKRLASSYSASALEAAFAERELRDAVDDLLSKLENGEPLLGRLSTRRLPPLPDDASKAQTRARALERSEELAGKPDAFWQRLYAAAEKEEANDKDAASEASDTWKETRAALQDVGLETIKKFGAADLARNVTEAQANFDKLREALIACWEMRQDPTAPPDAKSDPKANFLALLKTLAGPTAEDLKKTLAWVQEMSESHIPTTAAALAKEALEAERKDLLASLPDDFKKIATELGEAPAGAIPIAVELLDQSQSLEEHVAAAAKLQALTGSGLKAGAVIDLVRRTGQLLASARYGNFAAVYPKAVEAESSRWIKTPCVVISTPIGEAITLTGGHNVDPRITHFEIAGDGTVPRGSVKLVKKEGQDVILIHEEDAAKASSQVRLAGSRFKTIDEMLARDGDNPLIAEKARRLREQTLEDLRNSIRTVAAPPFRPQLAALRIPPARGIAARGALPPETPGSAATARWDFGSWSDFRSAPKSILETAGKLNEPGTTNIIVQLRADGTIDLYSPPFTYLRAGNRQAAVDFCGDEILANFGGGGGKGPVRIHLEGFPPDEGAALLISVRTRTGTTARDLFGSGGKGGKVLRSLEGLPLPELKLSEAKIQSSHTISSDGKAVGVMMEIPRAAAEDKVQVTGIVRFKTAATTLYQRAADGIRGAFRKFVANNSLQRDAVAQLRLDIQAAAKDLGDADAAVQVASEMGDFYIVEVVRESPEKLQLALR